MEKANEGDESNDFDYALDTEGDNYADNGYQEGKDRQNKFSC